jgi:pimeloyl-ACP methyl ester carboxylesterase
MRALVFLLATLLAQAGTSREAAAAPAEVLEFGDFALSIPAEVPTVRGILLALGGPDTRAFLSDGSFGAPIPELEASLNILGQELRTLAADHGLALLGTSRQGLDDLPNQPESDALIFKAIDEAARISGRRELTRAPIVLYGISGGTLQAAGFTARNPERVGALLLKVPGTPERLISAEALAVPTYLILAEHDVFADNEAVIAAFESNRRAGGLWAVAMEPGVPHHSLTPSHRALTANWLRAIVELRLGDSVQHPLRDVPESSGWLGHPDIGVAHWAGYTGDRKAASWFPSRATAAEWWEFEGGDEAR